MNKKEFSDVLKIARNFYRPYTGNTDHDYYMCFALYEAQNCGLISFCEELNAGSHIRNLIKTPCRSNRLYKFLGYDNYVSSIDAKLMNFWNQHIIEGAK